MAKKHPNLFWLAPCFSFLAILMLWGLMTSDANWNTLKFPGPVQTATSMWELIESGALVKHTVASLFRVTLGFYLAVLLGVPVGIILGRLEIARQFLNPVINFLRPISPLAWIPLAMIWFGMGDKPAVFLIFLSSFFPLAVSTTAAVSKIDPVFFCVAANFNLNQKERLQYVIFPAILPAIITSLRISVGVAWLVVVAAEMIAVQSGLGYLILDSRNAMRIDNVVNAMIVIGVIGLVLDCLMKRLGRMENVYWGAA